MPLQLTIRGSCFVMALLFAFELASATESKSYSIQYKQHWKPPDTPPAYGQGQVVATYPSVGEAVFAVTFTITLADSGYTNEWDNGRTSEWDLVSSNDGANWSAEQVRISPTTFVPHAEGGTMTIVLSMALDKTNGQQKHKDFEIYGTRWGMNVSPKTKKGAHFLVRGKVRWNTDNGSVVQECVLDFLGTDQASGLLRESYFPQRKVDYDRELPPVTEYTKNMSWLGHRRLDWDCSSCLRRNCSDSGRRGFWRAGLRCRR